jgi:hypothetical protein
MGCGRHPYSPVTEVTLEDVGFLSDVAGAAYQSAESSKCQWTVEFDNLRTAQHPTHFRYFRLKEQFNIMFILQLDHSGVPIGGFRSSSRIHFLTKWKMRQPDWYETLFFGGQSRQF